MTPRADRDIVAGLVSQCRRGDPQAFEQVFALYRGPLYAYLARATGDRHEAEDLLQDVFVRLVENLDRYEESGRFEAWVFRIAANRVRDWARRRKRAERTASAAPGGRDDDGDGPLPGVLDKVVETPPEERLVAGEQLRRLELAMAELEAEERQVLVLRHYGDLSFREIADIMGSPLGTVLAKSHRALLKLREKMNRPAARSGL
jgi:RNA polymerase sigma-70 factor (ECF subfamily)